MKRLVLYVLVSALMYADSYAISKTEFLALPFKARKNYGVIDGTYSSEYAISRQEYEDLSDEIITAVQLEIQRQQFLYAKENIGKKEKELDQSRLYDLGAIAVMYGKDPGIQHPELAINYARLGSFCASHFKAAPYYYKHYLEWKKFEKGQPSLWPKDSENVLLTGDFFGRHKLYKDWDRMLADYNDFWWKPQAEPYCKQFPHIKNCVNKWLNKNQDYQGFLKEWGEIKKLAKTTKPKPLDPAVQHHEWFYSDKQEEVLKALEYYHKHDVRFMLEKALKHKDSVIAAKAREYLDAPVKEKEPTGDGNKK